jgi:hypothetical protein
MMGGSTTVMADKAQVQLILLVLQSADEVQPANWSSVNSLLGAKMIACC